MPRKSGTSTFTGAAFSNGHQALTRGTRLFPRDQEEFFRFVYQGILDLRTRRDINDEKPYQDAKLYSVRLQSQGGLTADPSDFDYIQLDFKWYDFTTNANKHIEFGNDPTYGSTLGHPFGSWDEEPLIEPSDNQNDGLQQMRWLDLTQNGITLGEAFNIVQTSPRLTAAQGAGPWDRIRIVKFITPKPGLRDEIVYQFDGSVYVGSLSKEAIPIPVGAFLSPVSMRTGLT